jgi:hypothetical protein
MVSDNSSQFKTAFTVTIEAATGVTTGVSAQDRTTTVKAAIKDGAVASDLTVLVMYSLFVHAKAVCSPVAVIPKERLI